MNEAQRRDALRKIHIAETGARIIPNINVVNYNNPAPPPQVTPTTLITPAASNNPKSASAIEMSRNVD